LRLADSTGQRLLARIVFFGLSGSLAIGTLTAIVLPALRLDVIGCTTGLVALVGLGVAWTLRRFGYSLIAPEAFAREILDTLEDGVVLMGEDGRLRDANRAFLRMIGEAPLSAIGRPIRAWLPDLPGPGVIQDPSGSTLRRLERRVGGAWPVVLSAPVACRAGTRLVGHALLVRDRREVVSLQRQLAVSARLAAVGDLALPISQAISEPTARVREELEGLALDWEASRDVLELAALDEACAEAIEEGRELIAECIEGAGRITSIVREVAGFSSEGDRQDFADHPLDRIVDRAMRIAAAQAPSDLAVDARLEPGVRILCHFAEIERVVTNLLVNAIHALAGKPAGRRRIAVDVTTRGHRARVTVEDDGCGIEPELIDRIFDPFFTTKPVGKGTGLGLAISYHIVRAHGGEIHVASEPGRGTRVTVDLPVARTGPRAEQQRVASQAAGLDDDAGRSRV
jgi:signal transduction histidine kinase